MASKTLFNTKTAHLKKVRKADTVNAAGGKAYSLSDETALAKYLVTSTFNSTFYHSEEEIFNKLQELAKNCSNEFLAKAAVYARSEAKMKDTPTYLLALLTTRGDEGIRLFERIFPRVVTNFKTLQNFVQIVRSGQLGRRSFGSAPKRAIRNWLASRRVDNLFTGSIGADPSFADVIKMVHPKAEDDTKNNFYRYMLGKDYELDSLTEKIQQFENFKTSLTKSEGLVDVPDVPFQMLSALPLKEKHWKEIAVNMPWNTLRMNLNTLNRHGVFNDKKIVSKLAAKLRDPDEIHRSMVFPYQLYTSYLYVDSSLPMELNLALQDALEVAIDNIPRFDSVAVGVDISGSMTAPVTGHRKGSTSKIQCRQVAALVASSVLRKNPEAIILPFHNTVQTVKLNPRDSVMTNAKKIDALPSGGTDCSAPIRVLNGIAKDRPELVIILSDNESWVVPHTYGSFQSGYYRSDKPFITPLMTEWATYTNRTPKAKLVCNDLAPNPSSQAYEQPGVLNIGGFSDACFSAIKRFVECDTTDFSSVINSVDL